MPQLAKAPIQARGLDQWNAAISAAFDNLTVDADEDGFEAQLEMRCIGALKVSRVASAPAVVRRARRASQGPDPGRYFKLHVQDIGSSANRHAGHEAVLNPGDLMLCDSSQPYSITFGQPNHMLVLRLPEDRILQRLRRPEGWVGRRIGAEAQGAAVLAAFVRGLWNAPEGRAADSADPAFLDVAIDLLSITLDQWRAQSEPAAPAQAERIRRFVDEHLCDPNLTVTRVAQGLGVTPRYVQMVFAALGVTPLTYIRTQRLRRAAQRLRRGDGADSITALAFDLGFNDLSHFSRAFKAQFGVGPREYRAR